MLTALFLLAAVPAAALWITVMAQVVEDAFHPIDVPPVPSQPLSVDLCLARAQARRRPFTGAAPT